MTRSSSEVLNSSFSALQNSGFVGDKGRVDGFDILGKLNVERLEGWQRGQMSQSNVVDGSMEDDVLENILITDGPGKRLNGRLSH